MNWKINNDKFIKKKKKKRTHKGLPVVALPETSALKEYYLLLSVSH